MTRATQKRQQTGIPVHIPVRIPVPKGAGPYESVTVKRDSLFQCGRGKPDYEVPVISLVSNNGLMFPIPLEVAAEVATRIMDLVGCDRDGLQCQLQPPLGSMFPGRSEGAFLTMIQTKRKPRKGQRRHEDVRR